MSKPELASNRLYVVRPSVVTFDDTEYSFRKTMDKVIMTSPSSKLSRNQIYCIKNKLCELNEQAMALEKKSDKTELEILELENIKLNISCLELIPLDKPTVADYIKNIRWGIMNAQFKKERERNINNLTHIVQFETRPEDVTIALEEAPLLKSVETDKVIYDGIGHHCIVGDLHVGVCPNDKVLLARYLWEKSVHNTKYSNEIERYINSLKPFYTIEEIVVILEQLRSSLSSVKEDQPKVFTLERKRKEPILIKR